MNISIREARVIMLLGIAITLVAAVLSMTQLMSFYPFSAVFYMGTALLFCWLFFNPTFLLASISLENVRISQTQHWLLFPSAVFLMIVSFI